jgi:hypothetical protein
LSTAIVCGQVRFATSASGALIFITPIRQAGLGAGPFLYLQVLRRHFEGGIEYAVSGTMLIRLTIFLVTVTCCSVWAQGRSGSTPGGGRPGPPGSIGRGVSGAPSIGASPIGISPGGTPTGWPQYSYPAFVGYVGHPPGAAQALPLLSWSPCTGWSQFPGWGYRLGWSGGSGWSYGSLYAAPSFVGAPYSVPMPIDTSQYSPPRVYTPPPQNDTLVMPPPPVPIWPPNAIPALQSDPPISSGSTLRPAPAAQVTAQNEDYPALIALKNGGIYSAWNYWTSAGEFHFIISHGEHIAVPANSVDRVYPPKKNGRSVQPPGAPRRN